MPAPPRIDCRRCAYYFVTWDPCFPHGCRRMGFKGRVLPAEEVRRTMSGHECLLFQANTRGDGHALKFAPSSAPEVPPSR
jgi:hypothetical protein